jgi:hypothetical protein
LEHVPQKILNLLPVINVLAHQPWKLTREHIAVNILFFYFEERKKIIFYFENNENKIKMFLCF